MVRLEHRDMTISERRALESEARAARGVRPGWSSRTLAVLVLMGGSFVLGLLLFGLPATSLVELEEGSGEHHAALFGPALASTLIGGAWSVAYYLRGSWRVDPRLLDDLDYGRVEVVAGTVLEAWVIDDLRGTTWLLDLGDEILLVGPPATTGLSPRTFPGRRIELVRCKHSGIVLRWETEGPPLAPSGRLRSREHVLGITSARCEGGLTELVESMAA